VTVTKKYGSSWIFEPCLTCANTLRLVQHPGFSLGSSSLLSTASLGDIALYVFELTWPGTWLNDLPD
jgi:hypothetical protein